jgi:hypothetical protein
MRNSDATSGRTAPPIFQSVSFRQGQLAIQPKHQAGQSMYLHLIQLSLTT